MKKLVFLLIISVLVPILSMAVLADTIFIEAESGKNNGTEIIDFEGSYSGKIIQSGVTDDGRSIEYTFNIKEAGTYLIWARVRATGQPDNSFWYTMNGSEQKCFDFWDEVDADLLYAGRDPRDNFYNPDIHNSYDWFNKWYWMPMNYRVTIDGEPLYRFVTNFFELNAGANTLTLYSREEGTKIDKFIITNDLSYDPNTINGDPELAYTPPTDPGAGGGGGNNAGTGDPALIFGITALLGAGAAYIARKKQK